MSSVGASPPEDSVLNMKVGDILKKIMESLQQLSKSAQGLAQTETDPTAKAALASVAKTIDPTSTTSIYNTNTSTAAGIPPTTITISQSGNTTSTTLPSVPSTFMTPSSSSTIPSLSVPPIPPALITPTTSVPAAATPMKMPSMSDLPALKYSKRPTLPTAITIGIIVILGAISISLALTDTFAFLAFVVLVTFIGFILYSYGFVQIRRTDTELDVTYNLSPFEEVTEVKTTLSPIKIKPLTEVFYVADNTFTYAQAPAVCKAYGATLASYSQVEEAYEQGAEWCGYGWSEGGIALFPTQQATWDKMQKEPNQQTRIKCGRPGINGGYFDPGTQFGVNCYGVRPAKKASDVAPPTVADDGMDRLVAQFQQNIAKYVVSPFNQKVWSETQGNPQDIQLSQTQTPSVSAVPGSVQPVTPTTSNPTSAITTATDTILTATQSIPRPPISAPTDILARIEELGSAPMGLLNDAYDHVSEFVQDVV
jgi:hypothetical protein